MKPTETASASPLNLRCVLLISLVAALGGLLFVYDAAVVSDAIGFLTKHFYCPPNSAAGRRRACRWVACLAGFSCWCPKSRAVC